MSMTLDGFIARAFPLEGRLDQITCGHSFLRNYSDNDILNLTPKHAFHATVQQGQLVYQTPEIRGTSPIVIGPETKDKEAQGNYPDPPSLFERKDVYRALSSAFRGQLEERLTPRLGTRYAEFEKRLLGADIPLHPDRVSVAHVSRLCTVAREVKYLADADSEIQRIRDANIDAFEAAALASGAPGGASNHGHVCLRCVDRDTHANVAERYRAIIESAPQAYKSHLIKRATAATADMTTARDNAVSAERIHRTPPCGRNDVEGVQSALDELVVVYDKPQPRRDRIVNNSDVPKNAHPVAAAASNGPSLLQRLLCCWQPAPPPGYQRFA